MKRSIVVVSLATVLSGCMAGTMERADTFSANQTNKRQESKLIEIAMIEKARVQVNNKRAQKAAEIGGALFGALLGARNDSGYGGQSLVGASIGSSVAGKVVGAKKIVDGVSLTYVENGSLLTSAQVGSPCEFAPGPALVITTGENETRVQPNAVEPCVEGSEHVAGSTSKMAALAKIKLKKGSKDRMADLQREKELLRREREMVNAKRDLQRSSLRGDQEVMDAKVDMQRSRTRLRTEEQRTNNASRSADQEIEARDVTLDRGKAINEGIRSISKGVGKGAEKGIVGTTVIK
jgi:outer membrane lipoprotein SlyB